MAIEIRDPGSEYVLNHCAKHLNRAGPSPSPGDEEASAALRARIAEAWRFPIIGFLREQRPDDAPPVNLVTFIYKGHLEQWLILTPDWAQVRDLRSSRVPFSARWE